MTAAIQQRLREILLLARQVGATKILFAIDGVQITDQLGITTTPTIDGAPVAFDADELHDALRNAWRNYSSEIEFDHAKWPLKETDAGIELRPKKPLPAHLGAIASIPEDELAALRSLYGKSGIELRCFVEGEPRRRDVANAMLSELRMAGCGVHTGNLDVEYNYLGHPDPDPNVFDQESEGTWFLELEKSQRGYHTAAEPDPKKQAAVSTVNISQSSRWRSGTIQQLNDFEDQGKPIVMLIIGLVDSKPQGRIGFSPSARALVDVEIGRDPDKPWNVLAAAAEKRKAAQPKRMKTWLPTTAAVGEAFVDQKIPRGYVSGKSLFFHGPVAFSTHDENPIAAFVKDLDGNTVLVKGRTYLGDAVTSMAQGDISSAMHAKGIEMDTIIFGDLRPIVQFADMPADRLGWHFRNSKDESKHGSHATLDPEGVADWYRKEVQKAREEIDAAHNSGANYPTLRKVESLAALIRLEERADRVKSLFGIECPRIADLEQIKADHSQAVADYDERQERLKARKEAESAPAP